MKEFITMHFGIRDAFREWLQDNYDKCEGIWMIFYKKQNGLENISYDEAVEEALCFGWIDSIIKRIDNKKYVRKFTPRTNISLWSDLNKKRVTKMIKAGKMKEAGLKKIDIYIKTGKVDWENEKIKKNVPKKPLIPGFILEEFAKNKPAIKNFNNLAPTFKRQYILWITNAKRKETIDYRIKESIKLLKANKKLGLK